MGTSISLFDLIDSYTKTNNVYGVYISYQFDLDDDTSKISWAGFIKVVTENFDKDEMLYILPSVINSELMILPEDKTVKLFNIMNDRNTYYSEVYACLSGPEGLITENT